VKPDLIIKLICNKLDKKTRLTPLYKRLKILQIKNIYRLKIAKFMFKIQANKLPNLVCEKFAKLSTTH